MQAELAGAEAANSAIASTLLSDTPDVLPPLIQRAKTQLHVLSITEALHEAAAAAHTTADLPRLDSAILAAQKAGLDGLLPEPCRSVSCLHIKHLHYPLHHVCCKNCPASSPHVNYVVMCAWQKQSGITALLFMLPNGKSPCRFHQLFHIFLQPS